LNLRLKEYSLVFLLLLTEFTRSAFFLTFWPLYSATVLNLPVATTGLVVSAHYLTETIFKSAAGYQLDRYGRPVLLTGLGLSLLSLTVIYHLQTGWMIALLAGLFGLGFTPVWLAVISQVAPCDCPNRGGRMGIVFSAWLIGAGTGPIAVNFILPLGFHQVFQLLILLWFVSLIMVLFIPISVNTTTMGISLQEQFKRLAGNAIVARVLLPGMFLQTMAASLLLPILPLYATRILGLDPRQYGLLLTAGGAATVLLLVPMGRLVDRYPLQRMLAAGFSLSAIFLAVFPLTHKLNSLFLLVILVGASYAMVLPAWNTLLARAIPAEFQATGWGIFTALEGLGIAAGPTLGGFVSGWVHPAGAIYLSAFILGLMGLFYLTYPLENLLTRSEL